MSDIHANLAALEAVWQHASSQTEKIEETWVLGDIVDYGPQPNQVVDYLRHLPNLSVVKGNHEAMVLSEISLRYINPMILEVTRWTSSQLTKESAQFLRNLPPTIQHYDVTLCHASPRDPMWEYVTSVQIAQENLDHFTTSGCVVGHTHMPFALGFAESNQGVVTRPKDGDNVGLNFNRWFINPGSVGQPRDQDPRASYALLHIDTQHNQSTKVEFHRADYDIRATQELMLDAGIPPFFIYRLAQGH